MRTAESAGPSSSSLKNTATLGALGVCVTSMLGMSVAHAADAVDDPDGDGDGDGKKVEQVTVKGVRSLLDDKLPGDQLDTPQSLTVVTEKLMTEQGNTRLEDALKNVPGITLNSGEGAARGDTVNLRGFSAFNDFFLDGIRDAAVYSRDTFDIQSVEVLKGPAATLFGRGSTGGAINQVTKAPGLAPFDTLTIDAGTNDEGRGALDLDAPL